MKNMLISEQVYVTLLSKTIQVQDTNTIQAQKTNQETTKDEKSEPAFHNSSKNIELNNNNNLK